MTDENSPAARVAIEDPKLYNELECDEARRFAHYASLPDQVKEGNVIRIPKIFVGIETETRFPALCVFGAAVGAAGSWIFSGPIRHRCGNYGCICTAEEDTQFRPATDEEAQQYWSAMQMLADQALYEIEHDL